MNQLPVMLAESQLQAFSVARRLVMFSDVVRTCRERVSRKHGSVKCRVTNFVSCALGIIWTWHHTTIFAWWSLQDLRQGRSHRGAGFVWPQDSSHSRICKTTLNRENITTKKCSEMLTVRDEQFLLPQNKRKIFFQQSNGRSLIHAYRLLKRNLVKAYRVHTASLK